MANPLTVLTEEDPAKDDGSTRKPMTMEIAEN